MIPNSRQHQIVCRHAALQTDARIQLRPARQQDIPGISTLLDRSPGVFPRSGEEIFQTLPGWLVAVERGRARPSQPLGCVSFEAISSKTVEIRSLAVSAAGLKENVGPLLLLEIERIARERGYSEICARRVSRRQKEKLRFYRSVLLDDGSWCDYECTHLKVDLQAGRAGAGAALDIEVISGNARQPDAFEAIRDCFSHGGYRLHRGAASETVKPARVFLFRTYERSGASARERAARTRPVTQH